MRLLILFVIVIFLSPAAVAEEAPLSVMSFNIRYHNLGDGVNAWPLRKQAVAELILSQETDIAGLQEALPGQIEDLASRLPEYQWYGVGRDDGKKAGEFTPIFYKKDRLEKRDAGEFWLSETPEVAGSKGWDAAITRVAVWVKLADRKTEKEIIVFNTHFDHIGYKARAESAKLIRRKIEALAGGAPFMLLGDFNCRPDSTPYKTLTGGDSPLLQNARLISKTKPAGPDSSWNGFREIVPGQMIDFIFVSPRVTVSSHAILETKIKREGHADRFPSDHLPVTARIIP